MDSYSKAMDPSTCMVTKGDGKMPAYTISLDEIDLSLIPIFSHQQRDSTVPIWSPAASGPGAEYYEIQVLAEEGSSDDETLENATTQMCHVCGVQVCASYWQRHTTSAIHQANQAIARTSLNRVQQMALAAPVAPSPPRTTTYFCPPCSSAVALSKRTTHKQTEQHSSAVLYQKLLQSLARLYESKNNLSAVCDEVLKAIGDHDTVFEDLKSRREIVTDKKEFTKDQIKNENDVGEIEEENLNKEDNNVNDTSAWQFLAPVTYYNREIPSSKKYINKDDDDDSTSSEAEASNQKPGFIGSLGGSVPKNEPEPKTPTDCTITALSGAKLRIPFENYHGLATISGSSLCRVCRVMLHDPEKHVATTTHVEIVKVPVKDKHCIRPLTSVLSHCMLCNDIVGNSDEGHMSSTAHLDALQRALVGGDVTATPGDAYTQRVLQDNRIQTVDFNEQIYFCQVCDIYIFKSALMEHIAIDAHRNGLKTFRPTKKRKATPVVKKNGANFCEYCKVAIGYGKKAEKRHLKEKEHQFNQWLAEKDTMLHYHFKECGPEHAVCNICSERVEISMVDQHVNGYNHQKIYKSLLKANHMQKAGEYGIDCLLCNIQLYMVGLTDHIKKNSHKKKIQQCFANDIGPEEFALMHRPDQDSNNSKLKKILQLNQIHNHSNDDSYYECRLCFTSFQKSSLLEHIVSNKHIKVKRQVSTSQGKKEEIKLKSKSFLYSQYESQINANKEHEVYTPDNVPAEKQKEKETSVDAELQLAMKTNLIESHSDRFNWCNACKRLVTKDLNIMLHIDSKNHKRNLAEHDDEDLKAKKKLEANQIEKRRMLYYCNACDVCFTVGHEDAHIKLESHASNIAKMDRLRQDELSKSGTQYYCALCLEWVPRGSEYDHISKEKHKTNFEIEEKLKSQGVVKTGINYFCEICLVSVQRWFGEEHINSDDHLLMFKTKYRAKRSNDETEKAKDTQADTADVTDQSNPEKEIKPVKITDESDITKEMQDNPAISTSLEIASETGTKEGELVESKAKIPADNDKTTDEIKRTREMAANSIKTSVQPAPKLTLHSPTKKLHYLFAWTHDSGNEVMCVVCKTNLSFYNIMMHRKSKTHKDVYQDVLDSNTMFRIRHRCFCECCREIMKVNEEYAHITSENHRCNLTRNTERLGKKELMEISIRMFNDDVAVRKRIKIHERYDRTSFAIEESDGEDSKSNSSTATFDEFGDENNSDNENSVLNISYDSTKTNIPDCREINDDIDLYKIPEDHEEVEYIILKTQSQDVLELPANFQNIAHLFEQTDNIKELSCLICKTVVGNWSDLITLHLEGNKHLKKYKRVLKINDFTEIVDTTSGAIQNYTCKSCGIDVGKSNLFEHINSVKHKMYLNAQPSTSGYSQQPNESKTDLETNKLTEAESRSTSNLDIDTTNSQISTESLNITIYNSKLKEQKLPEIDLTPNKTEDTHKTNCLIKPLNQTLTSTAKSQPDIHPLNQPDKIQLKSAKNEITKKIKLSDTQHIPSSIKTQVASAETKGTKQTIETDISVKSPTFDKCVDVSQLHENPSTHRQIVPYDQNKSKPSLEQSDKTPTVPTTPTDAKDNQKAPKYLGTRLCVICNVDVPNNVTSIREHLAGIQHSENLTASKMNTTKNDLPTTTNKNTLADKTKFNEGNQYNNENNAGGSQGKTLIGKIPIPYIAEAEAALPENNVNVYVKKGYCHLCSVKITNNVSNIKTHVDGKLHQENLKQFDTIQMQHQVKNSDRYIKEDQCILCKTGAIGGASNVKDHVNGNKHKKKLRSLLTNKNILAETTKSNEVNQQNNENNTPIAVGSQRKTSVRQINIPYISPADALLPENNVNIYVKNGHCYLCSKEIPNNVSNITAHVIGRNHREILEQFDTIEVLHEPHIPMENKSVNIVQKISNNTGNVTSNRDHSSAIIVNSSQKQTTTQKTSETSNSRVSNITPTNKVENKVTTISLSDKSTDRYIKEEQCILCKTGAIGGASNVKDHVNGNKHKKMLQSLLPNKNTLADTTKSNEVNQQNNENNTPIVGGSQKKTSVRKINIPNISLADALLPENNVDIYVKNGQCYLCSMDMPKGVPNIKAHVIGRNHQGNLKQFDTIEIIHHEPPVPSEPNASNSAIIVKNIHNPGNERLEPELANNSIENNGIKLGHCHLCSVNIIPYNIPCIKDHINGDPHRNMRQLLLSKTETMIKSDTQTGYDVFVKKYIVSDSNQNTSGQVETKKERDITIPIILGVELKLPENNIDAFVKEGFCYLCNMKLPYNISNIKDHVEHENHLQNLQSVLNDSTRKIYYVCPACNIKFPKTGGSVVSHLKSTMHIANIRILTKDSIKPSENTKSNDTVLSETTNKIIDDSALNIDPSTSTYSTSNVQIIDSNINKEEFTQNECTNYNDSVLATNTPVEDAVDIDARNKTSNSGSHFGTNNCEVIEKDCSKDKTGTANDNKAVDVAVDKDAKTETAIENKPVDSEAIPGNNCKTENDETDDSDVEALDEGFYICRVCDKLVLDNETDIKSHLDSVRHKMNLKEKHFKEGKFPNTKTSCDICNIDIPNNPIATKKHADSVMHKMRFEKVLLENKINIREDKVCYCELCDLYFSKFTVPSHVKRPDHVRHFT